MHAPLSCLLLSILVLSHSASSKALSKRNDPTYINRIGLGRVRLNVCSEINYKKCFLGWDPNISYFDHADSIVCYDVQRIFSIKSIEIPYGVTCDLYSARGAGGIGVLVVEGLAKKGVKVAVLDLVDLPERVAALPNVKFCKCDITSKDDVERAASEIRTSFGSPSILCNNAGIAHAHTILEAAPEYLTKLFNVNVISQFYTIQAFLPGMIKANKGHVISTASVASFITCCGLVDYAASKAAVMALNEGLQQELKHRYNAPEIKTSIVHPIYVKTPLVTSYAKSLEKSKAVQIDPEVVANAILRQIESGRSGKVVLPAIFAPLANARAWADWVHQLIGDSSKDDVKNEGAVAKAG
ncbi:hypothetical protein EG328_003838 [Venturia inaequalis]|uniref:Uncharacterized protein n=1 Tax=Venturia inaequalis TaxID=5025 RepID=A0A8H3ZC94_VENIN|nr:hypothetical protein EG328_003838 [Venturia inaequalis]